MPTTKTQSIARSGMRYFEIPHGSLRVRILWYKDGKRLTNSRKIKIKHKRQVLYKY